MYMVVCEYSGRPQAPHESFARWPKPEAAWEGLVGGASILYYKIPTQINNTNNQGCEFNMSINVVLNSK